MESEVKRLAQDAPITPGAGDTSNLWSAFQDPQILMDPERLERIRSSLPEQAVPLFESLLRLMKESFSLAIEHVFLTGSIVLPMAFISPFPPVDAPQAIQPAGGAGNESGAAPQTEG